ncbi:hypothetical protein EVAR_4302_1 [Eumeta japonica]|uniref:Uncharacterized protein n=1 Tax=Eumeta variegata TaxID=151549 RepID=A0A4C1VAK9_EUMVA|nr:hypothetical protein EVAR_4302_1 [Eumeta japonica]
MDDQIIRWLHEDHSDDEDLRDVVVHDLESDVEQDGIIDGFRANQVTTSSDDSSSEDSIPLSDFTSGNLLRVFPIPKNLKGKDGFRWTGEKPSRCRTLQRNIILHPPGPKAAAREIKTELEA